jgi:hypothetical protein
MKRSNDTLTPPLSHLMGEGGQSENMDIASILTDDLL